MESLLQADPRPSRTRGASPCIIPVITVKHVVVVSTERHVGRLIEVNLSRQGYSVSLSEGFGDLLGKVSPETVLVIVDDSRACLGDVRSLLEQQGSGAQVLPLTEFTEGQEGEGRRSGLLLKLGLDESLHQRASIVVGLITLVLVLVVVLLLRGC
jgi:hypothetical protein